MQPFGVLDRYIGKTIFTTIMMTLFMLVSLSGIIKFVDQLKKAGQGSYDALGAGMYTLLSVPKDVQIFFPMAALLGALLGLGMLAQRSELVVMQASGFTRMQVALSVMTHSLLVLMVAAILGGMIAAPQIVGMADTVLRSLRDEPGFWWHTYRRTWKINARASLIPGAVFGLIFGGEIFLYTHLASMQAGTGIITMLLLAVLLSLGVSNYIWAQIALLNLPFFTILKNGMFLFLAYLPVSLGATVVLAVYWGAVVLLFPISFPVLLLTNFWLPMVPSLLIVYTALDKSFEIEKTLKEQQEESAESNS